jgi:hypothetical protein
MNPEQLRRRFSVSTGTMGLITSLNENMVRFVADDDAAANSAFDLWMARASRNRRRRLMGCWDHRDVLGNGTS